MGAEEAAMDTTMEFVLGMLSAAACFVTTIFLFSEPSQKSAPAAKR
jgi:hypothetical protein